ncbi:MAG: AraC family transcriptional regulator [Lachnospiraceae bacterium]
MIDHASIAMSHGKTLASERAEGINDNMSSSHYHDFFELYYLESGERYHRIRDQLYLLKAGEFIVFPPRVMHHSFSSENVPFKRILVYFDPKEVDSAPILDYFIRDFLICFAPHSGHYHIHNLINMIYTEHQEQGIHSKEYQHTLLNLLLLTIMRNAQPVEKREDKDVMSQMIQYIYEHYPEDISIELLSQRFFLSPYYLCRKFKQATGNTVIQYLNTTRILNAQRMMLETNKNFTQISNETGFSNLTHFNRVFKSVTGMTPSMSRKQNRISD